jgi:hypothetical protein
VCLDALADVVGVGDAVRQRRADDLIAPDADKLGSGVGRIGEQPLDRAFPSTVLR